MGEVHDINELPPGPFARSGGTWLCLFCESARDNPQWFCVRCKPFKRVDPEALEELPNPHVVEAERRVLDVFGDDAKGWENATWAGDRGRESD